MKIISSTHLKELDKYTIANEPITSIDLMERAAHELTRTIMRRWDASFHIVVFAGPGNNGGDALAVARLLSQQNYRVEVFLFNTKGKLSEECQINLNRLKECGSIYFTEVSTKFDPPFNGLLRPEPNNPSTTRCFSVSTGGSNFVLTSVK